MNEPPRYLPQLPDKEHSNGTEQTIDLAARAHHLDHDLRTPIGTIATALDLLRAGNASFDESDLEALRILDRQVVKLTTLAESLRSLAEEMTLPAQQQISTGSA